MQWTWSFSGYLHLGTILLIPIYSSLSSCTLLHLRILYYMYSWLQKEAGLETICTVEVLGAPWLYCVFWFTELVHSVVCGEWLQSYSTCLSPIPQQLAEVLILAISARELSPVGELDLFYTNPETPWDDITPFLILNSIPTLILSNCLALSTYFTPRHKGLRIPGLFPYLVSVLRKGMLMASGCLNKNYRVSLGIAP